MTSGKQEAAGEDFEQLEATQRDPSNVAFRTRLSRFAYDNAASSCDGPGVSNSSKSIEGPTDGSTQARELRRTPAKRTASEISANDTDSSPKDSSSKKKRTTAKERSANDPFEPPNKLVDSLRPGMTLVFIGLNPGLETARTGHAYSHRSNLFWKLLHESGVTSEQHLPSQTHELPDLYNIGNTNICARPTRDGSGLSKAELAEGAVILEAKIREYKPEAVAIVGKGIWEALWLARTGKKLTKKDFKYGWQDEEAWLGREVDKKGQLQWSGARTFVTTTTSGLAAGMKPHEKLAIWEPLGDWFSNRRKELAGDA